MLVVGKRRVTYRGFRKGKRLRQQLMLCRLSCVVQLGTYGGGRAVVRVDDDGRQEVLAFLQIAVVRRKANFASVTHGEAFVEGSPVSDNCHINRRVLALRV